MASGVTRPPEPSGGDLTHVPAALAGTAPAPTTDVPVRLGVVGLGRISEVQLEVLRDLPQFEVVALADPRRAGEVDGIDVVADHRDLLSRDDVGAVAVNTPPDSHYPIARDALRAGKHVFLEKPPTLVVDDARRLSRLASEQDLCLFMAFHARYNPPVVAARALLAGERVLDAVVDYREDVLRYHQLGGWVFDPEVSGGGVLMDSGINALSVLRALWPGLADCRVERAAVRTPPGYAVETFADVRFGVPGGARGRLTMDWLHEGPEVRRLSLRTARHTFELDLVQGTLRRDDELLVGSAVQTRSAVDQHVEYRAAYEDFAAHLAQGRSAVSLVELAFVQEVFRRTTPN